MHAKVKNAYGRIGIFNSKVCFIIVSSPIEMASRNSTYETPQLTQIITPDSRRQSVPLFNYLVANQPAMSVRTRRDLNLRPPSCKADAVTTRPPQYVGRVMDQEFLWLACIKSEYRFLENRCSESNDIS